MSKSDGKYTASFQGSNNFRTASFKTHAGAKGYLRRMWGYVFENPKIEHPDGTVDEFPMSIAYPKELERTNK